MDNDTGDTEAPSMMTRCYDGHPIRTYGAPGDTERQVAKAHRWAVRAHLYLHRIHRAPWGEVPNWRET